MVSKKYIIALDQGTTSTRALLFDKNLQELASTQKTFEQFYPENGWVEHDPEMIWHDSLTVINELLEKTKIDKNAIAALGLTNQRETTVLWDQETGEVVYRAIVWQDRRGTALMEDLKSKGLEPWIKAKTGLLADAYFCASKIHWVLQNIPRAKQLMQQKRLRFGTIDAFLIWRFTAGQVHATDITNASRTLLFNIAQQTWDHELLELFKIDQSILPIVKDCAADFGVIDHQYFGIEIPIRGVAGDQQAAAIGQCCFEKGMAKCTYGTGAFLLQNTGNEIIASKQLISTILYRIQNQIAYALEGSIFIAGAAIQWLRDQLHFFKNTDEIENLMTQLSDNGGVYFVTALTGLGAPYWKPHARGAILGLTRDTHAAHITRAALEAVCYQTRALLAAMVDEGATSCQHLRIDGGMTANNWLCQFLAEQLRIPVERPKIIETTALGAALLAGLGVGWWPDIASVQKLYHSDRIFTAKNLPNYADELYNNWQKSVEKIV
jgi:glycerol kinase